MRNFLALLACVLVCTLLFFKNFTNFSESCENAFPKDTVTYLTQYKKETS